MQDSFSLNVGILVFTHLPSQELLHDILVFITCWSSLYLDFHRMTDFVDVWFSSSIGCGYIGILNFINKWHSPSLSLVVSRIIVVNNLRSSSTTDEQLQYDDNGDA
uniref:Uncharacterized protein n=1 Tax=Arundo donax TaxID=35708 RepID=A0A0A9F9W3_ARUDO